MSDSISLPECECRLKLDGSRLFLCENPSVFVRDGLVTRSMCRTCPFAGMPRPNVVRSWNQSHRKDSLLPPFAVAVVIPCHNYGRFLSDAIESVLSQTIRPAEVLVIVDRSQDESYEVATLYEDQGVRTLHVDYGNVHSVRRLGFEQTTSNIVCFLDADDRLGTDYLEKGLACFDSDDVGIVYSDLDHFGTSAGKSMFPMTFSKAALHQENFIHAGSLVRRDALELTDGFSVTLDAQTASCTADWWLWKCVTAGGWSARKQSGRYHYRRHTESALSKNARNVTYFQAAWLEHEVLTLFIPLSGRLSLWPQMASFLDQQTWPHDQIRLILLDTSQNSAFSETVRRWTANSDYDDVRYIKRTVGPPNLADQPRRESATTVRKSMARIYNFLKCGLTTELVWILEDDVLPPFDVARRLLEHFDEQTVSVAAPYRSRFEAAYVVWDTDIHSYTESQGGVTTVGGNGFGCTIIRSGVIHRTAFSHGYLLPDFDRAFYASMQAQRLVTKVNWDAECLHFSSADTTPTISGVVNYPTAMERH